MLAQSMLRTAFGYELVELRGRGEENPLLQRQAEELDARVRAKRQRVDAEASDRRATKEGSSGRTYALRSTLPAELIDALASTSEDLATPPISWGETPGELGASGLLYVILSVVLLSGRAIAERKWALTDDPDGSSAPRTALAAVAQRGPAAPCGTAAARRRWSLDGDAPRTAGRQCRLACARRVPAVAAAAGVS